MAQRVAVIGCGAAGLCALRHLSARPTLFEAVAFEQLADVGGTWRYTEETGTDKFGLPVLSSMYKNLRTNIPKEVMAFPDVPFPSNLPSFMHHTDVLKYLEDYRTLHDLDKFIHFKTKVDLVKAVSADGKFTWDVTYSSVDEPDKPSQSQKFDAVIVGIGHYSVPMLPEIEGQEVFQGTITHSHDYREPEPFKDKVVVCLGGGASGQDVSLDIANHAKKVVISHNKARLQTPLPKNVVQQEGIERLTPDGVIYKDGSKEHIDVIMLCTGYRYVYPFLEQECVISVEDERVTPLYKHIIHAKYPSMAFLGICKTICPFPQFDCQVQFFLSSLDGTQILPSTEAMEAEIEAEYQSRLAEGLPKRYAHLMGPRQWAYNEELCKLGHVKRVDPVIRTLYDEVHRTRVLDLPNYKARNYRLTGLLENQFEEVPLNGTVEAVSKLNIGVSSL